MGRRIRAEDAEPDVRLSIVLRASVRQKLKLYAAIHGCTMQELLEAHIEALVADDPPALPEPEQEPQLSLSAIRAALG